VSNLTGTFRIEFPEDIPVIRKVNTILQRFSDFEVAELWKQFSRDYYCAGWILVNSERLEQFGDWLLQ
jgi:hypothetical protein